MKILCIGGGPGGLYSALLLKKRCLTDQVTVIDRNPAGATYGWGVVFSDETLGFLEESDAPTFQEITESFVRWEAIDIYFREQVVRSGGHAFSGIARARLLNILQRRCDSLGVRLAFETESPPLSELDDFDLVIACDGVNSTIRGAYASIFKPSFDTHATKFIWLGATLSIDAFTFYFRETEQGFFQVHAYPFRERISTFIVETQEATWRRAGLENASEGESISFCRRLFGEELQGEQLMSNRSSWLSFVTLRNETWHHRNIALLGDSAHTAHFSVGSGTKMAMEDAIALSQALDRYQSVDEALVAYEELRQPLVERTQTAARDSSLWFENVPRYAQFDPEQFAFSLLTRSKRVTYENLKLRDREFSERVDGWFFRNATGLVDSVEVPPPALTPLRLSGIELTNRIVLRPSPHEDAREGVISGTTRESLQQLSNLGPGLLLTSPTAVSAEGRISSGSPGMYEPEHLEAWKQVVASVRNVKSRQVAIQLNHAGRRGGARPRREGADRPGRHESWRLVSASPLPYTRFSRVPGEISREEMGEVCDDFVRAARWAEEAGFDVLELHFGHGYLVASFISPLTNHRTDEFGGPLDNRLRFPLELFDAVRHVWPAERLLSVCVSATDWSKDGIESSDVRIMVSRLKERGCDVINVVTGQTTADANPAYGRAWQTTFSDFVRNESRMPTITSGNISTADEVNTILASGRADLCIASTQALMESLAAQ